MQDKEENKRLEYQLGNLQVQVAEYQQIIQELSNKLMMYEDKYGSVFTLAKRSDNN